MKNLSAIILLFIANSISGISQGISMIAIPWYFTQQDSEQQYAGIYLAVTLVSLFWGPLSGTLVDRYNRKHIFMAIGVVSCLFLSMVAGAGYSLGYLPWYLVAAVFAMTFFNYNIHYPNLYAFVQEITEPKYYGKIASYIEIQGQLASVLAGASAAILLEGVPNGELTLIGLTMQLPFSIEAWTLYEIFALDAITYIIGFFFIAFIQFQPLKKRTAEGGSVFQRFQTGWQYLKTHPYLLLFGVASYSIFATVLVTTFYLIAIYVNKHLHEAGDVFASAEMCYAGGAVLAGLAIRQVFKFTTPVMSVIIMTWLTAGLMVTLAISHSLAILYVMFLLLGLTNAGTRIMRVNYLFQHIPNQVYGRAGSIFFISNIIFRVLLIGVFSLAFFHQGNNVVYAFGILSVFLVVSAVVMMLYYGKLVNPEEID